MFFNGFDIFFRTLFQIEGKMQWSFGCCFILDGFLFLFYLNWKNNISYIKRTNGISLQWFYFAIIWNLDSSPNSFWYNLRFGFTQCQFYLNSSKMLISDSTMYRLLGSFDQKTSTVRLVMREKFHKQQFLKLSFLPQKWFLGPRECPCLSKNPDYK